jgi:hypothetical protein
MKKRIAALFICLLSIGMMLTSSVTTTTVEATYGDPLTVDGTDIKIGGTSIADPLFGVCDTTVLQFAIMSWINGESATYAGDNQIFPNFGGTIPCTNSSQLWGKYFTLAEYYGLDLVRIGAADKWGTDLQYYAWHDHHDQYIALLVEMADYAEAHGVKVILVLAGTQDYPGPSFGAADNSFVTTSTAYANYIAYARDTMTCLKDAPGIGIIDVWNEPDHNLCWSKCWSGSGGKSAYHAWACDIADKTAAYNFHPRLIGVAGLGDMFGWGQAEFDLATGDIPFELNDRHYYAKINDAYLFWDPESWSQDTGKPLIWTELGNNTNYPEERWPFAEQQIAAAGGQAFVAMTMLGTANYPYTGEIVDTTVFPGDPEDPEDPGNGTDPGDVIDPGDGTGSTGGSSSTSRYAWASGATAVSKTANPVFLALPALGAALILGTFMAPKPQKRRKARRRRR